MVRNGVIMKILEKFGCALSERKQSVTVGGLGFRESYFLGNNENI